MDIIKIRDENGQWMTVPAFQGQIGKTPDFSIGVVQTGTAAQSAAASITGTAEYPILNLTLPRGDTGSVGIAVSSVEPTDQLVWVDSSASNSLMVPEINDDSVSLTDTWSSAKIRDFIYPVGSIYLSVNSVSPAAIFGGTWEQIQDTFLLAAGLNYVAGNSGGQINHTHTTGSHTLTIDEMPAHNHRIWSGYDDGGTTNIDTFRYQQWAHGGQGYHEGAVNINSFIESKGGSQAHNHGNTSTESNMPPYLVVYMWKRVS